MGIAGRVAGHIAANPVVLDTVSNTKPIRYHWGKAPKVHGWATEGAGGEDVVVYTGIRWVFVKVV